jgi:hypothetical protein
MQEGVIEAIELDLHGRHAALGVRGAFTDLAPDLLPHRENAVVDEPHVTRGRLQSPKFVNEYAFEPRLRDVHHPAFPLATPDGSRERRRGC